MKKRFKNLIKTEYRRVVAKLMIGMLLAGIPTVAGLSDIAFADDMAVFEDGYNAIPEVVLSDDADFEIIEDADTEAVEVSGIEEEGYTISADVGEETESHTPDEEASDGEYTGMLYDNVPMSGWFNDWNKYHKLKYGDKVTAIPGQYFCTSSTGEVSNYGVCDISLLGGYDQENGCWYGVATVPAYDSVESYGDKLNEGSAIVRIDGVSNVEIGKEYEATYLYDCNLYFGLDNLNDYPWTVQYKDGRIYTFTSWEAYGGLDDVRNFVTTAITKHGVSPTHCKLWLLYSTDIYGNDIRLHYRFADLDQDNIIRTPWYIPNIANKYQRKVEDDNEYGYRYKGFTWRDNKWQGAFEKWKNGTEYITTAYEPLPNDIISADDIGGFLTASDQWFDKRNSMGERVFMYGGKWYQLTDECTAYLRQWLVDNGYKKSVYPEKLPRGWTITQCPEYLEKYGQPTNSRVGYYAEEEVSWIYPDGTITEGSGKKEEKEDDPKNPDITEDDIPAPVTVEYKLGPVVVKNQLDIKQLVSANSATKMKYKVDNRKIAKVSSKGIMTGKNAGYVTVTGYAKVRNSSNKKKWVWKETGSVKVEITRPSFKGLDKNTLTIKFKGEPVDLNGYIINESPMAPTFSVNRSGMAKVSSGGIIEATGEGKAKVTVMFGKYKMKLKVIVTP